MLIKDFLILADLRDTLFSPKVVDIAGRAIEHYGVKSQITKAKEECKELVLSLYDYEQVIDDENTVYDKVDIKNAVIDEIADVLFITIQVAAILGEKEVAERILFKANRLESRMK
jgi:NTP pyrophosphatase (non-canonical NTP hydrolase)